MSDTQRNELVDGPIEIQGDLYDYSFYVWPDSEKPWPKAVFDLFKNWTSRTELTFSPVQFVRFRLDVESAGILLTEISRRPHLKEETVL